MILAKQLKKIKLKRLRQLDYNIIKYEKQARY